MFCGIYRNYEKCVADITSNFIGGKLPISSDTVETFKNKIAENGLMMPQEIDFGSEFNDGVDVDMQTDLWEEYMQKMNVYQMEWKLMNKRGRNAFQFGDWFSHDLAEQLEKHSVDHASVLSYLKFVIIFVYISHIYSLSRSFALFYRYSWRKCETNLLSSLQTIWWHLI